VASTVNGGESQPALRMRGPEQPSSSSVSLGMRVCGLVLDFVDDFAQALMIRHVEVEGRRRVRLEALFAAPGHVLDGGEGAVGHEEEVQVSAADEHVFRLVDYFWQGTEGRGRGLVAVGEERWVAADHVVCVCWGVQGGLYIAAVEVVIRTWGQRRESELRP